MHLFKLVKAEPYEQKWLEEWESDLALHLASLQNMGKQRVKGAEHRNSNSTVPQGKGGWRHARDLKVKSLELSHVVWGGTRPS